MNDILTILTGDALTRLRELPDESVQCCVTSPPYWGLRDYGTGAWEGGAADCDHVNRHGMQGATGQRADRTFTGAQNYYREACGKCGAVRVDQQIGLEKTPAEFVAKMVEVFEEVRRVLKVDGTCWVNLGDSYSANHGSGSVSPGQKQSSNAGSLVDSIRTPRPGFKPKDLCMIPARVAMALQEAGWYLRSQCPWIKRNGMPESVTDRPATSCEYVYLLSKSQRYFYDLAAVLKPCSQKTNARVSQNVQAQIGSERANGGGKTNGNMKAVVRAPAVNPKCIERDGMNRQNDSFSAAVAGAVTERNRRNTDWFIESWQGLLGDEDGDPLAFVVNPQPYKGAHFATFPAKLVRPCILTGSRPGDTVLDPFGGSGTTGQVALELGRKALLIELNPNYVKLIEQRCNVTPGLAL